MAELPEELRAEPVPRWIRQLVEDGVYAGERNKARFKLMMSLKDVGMDNGMIAKFVFAFNENCTPADDKEKVKRHIKYTLKHAGDLDYLERNEWAVVDFVCDGELKNEYKFRKGERLIIWADWARELETLGRAKTVETYFEDEYAPKARLVRTVNFFDIVTGRELDKKIVGELPARKTIFLCSAGKLVLNAQKTSYNLLVNDESGAGKDWVTSKTLAIWDSCKFRYHTIVKRKNPQEGEDDTELKEKIEGHVVKRTRISEKVLSYWHNPKFEPDWTWDDKVLYCEDISNNVLNSDVFKVMASSGSHAEVLIDQFPVDIEIAGKPVMIITAANSNPTNEIVRRFPMCSLDTSTDQTRAIMRMQAKNAAAGMSPDYDAEVMDALTMLKPVKVKVPFAERLPDVFKVGSIIMRTIFDRFLDYIKASAALYQYQRDTDKDGFLLAEGQDYDIARDVLMKTIEKRTMFPTTRNQHKIMEIMRGFGQETLMPILHPVLDIEAKVAFMSGDKLRRNLDRLTDMGLLEKGKISREKARDVLGYMISGDLEDTSIPTYKQLTEQLTLTNVTILTPICNGVTTTVAEKG